MTKHLLLAPFAAALFALPATSAPAPADATALENPAGERAGTCDGKGTPTSQARAQAGDKGGVGKGAGGKKKKKKVQGKKRGKKKKVGKRKRRGGIRGDKKKKSGEIG